MARKRPHHVKVQIFWGGDSSEDLASWCKAVPIQDNELQLLELKWFRLKQEFSTTRLKGLILIESTWKPTFETKKIEKVNWKKNNVKLSWMNCKWSEVECECVEICEMYDEDFISEIKLGNWSEKELKWGKEMKWGIGIVDVK